MKKLLVIGLVGLSLAACAPKSLPLNNAVTLNTMEGVASLYGTTLSAARAYKALPLCKTGTVASVTNICAQRSVIVRLQTADAKAVSAISKANAFIQAYPTVNASNLISAASQAVTDLQSLLATTPGVQ